jgi:hypothetical protein
VVAVGADPERDGVGRAVRQDGGEVGQRSAVEDAAYVGVEHLLLPAGLSVIASALPGFL